MIPLCFTKDLWDRGRKKIQPGNKVGAVFVESPHVLPFSYLAPCWVSCFAGACSSGFTAPFHVFIASVDE